MIRVSAEERAELAASGYPVTDLIKAQISQGELSLFLFYLDLPWRVPLFTRQFIRKLVWYVHTRHRR